MKKVISLVVLLCAFAGSALASAPEAALKALNLGNEKFVLEQAIGDGPLAVVIADEAIEAEPAALFGLAADRVAVIRVPFGPEAGLEVQAKDIAAPMILVLGLDEEAIWAVYANTLKASPELIHAVLKGQAMAQGALVNAETGAVTLLGAHPDQQVLVGRYLLSVSEPAAPEAAEAAQVEQAPAVEETEAPAEAVTEPAEESQADAVEPAAEAAVETHEEAAAEAHAEEAAEPAAEAHAAPADAHAAAPESGGGFGFMGFLLFVVALVGAVIFLDKVVLKD
jgi:hypothetical protein